MTVHSAVRFSHMVTKLFTYPQNKVLRVIPPLKPDSRLSVSQICRQEVWRRPDFLVLYRKLNISAIFHTSHVLPLNTKPIQHLYNLVSAVQIAQIHDYSK
jgi:hypothetical protein